MRTLLPIPCAMFLAATPALASTDDAWAAMRADIDTKCRALAPATGDTAIEVNPFGSERFGAAILTTTVDGQPAERAICVYDKQSQTAEVTAPFDADQ